METGQNVGVDVSTNWWNFHMNYEMATENSEHVGDFVFDVKLSKSGKLRFKAFRRTNPTYLSQFPYTQGVGLRFREDFNHVRDLFRRRPPPAIRRDDDERYENIYSEPEIQTSRIDI